MQDFFMSFGLDNPFVQHTLFAFASLALGMLGMVLGQRVATQGKLCLVVGVAVGLFTMWLLSTAFASLAPGFCGVFVVSFLASGLLMKLCCDTATGAGSKPSSPPSAGGPQSRP